MRKVFLFITLLGFVMILISCAMNETKLKESGAKLLSRQDLMEFFKVERVVSWKHKQVSGKSYYFPNRTQKMKWPNGGDEGEYRITRTAQICSKWKEYRGGKEKCFRLYHNGENEYVWVNPDGSISSSMTLTK